MKVALQNAAADKQTGGNDFVAKVRRAVAAQDLQMAERLANAYREEHGSAPETLEAFSWIARGALSASRFAEAAGYARSVHGTAVRQLRNARLDLDPHLATALGASIEVLAQAMVAQGHRAEAIRFLKREATQFHESVIGARIHKNLNLLTLEGRLAPELEGRSWIGARPPTLRELRGRVVLLFFWAHYCDDSQAEARVLARIQKQFDQAGLALLGPTRRYGYLDEHVRLPIGPRQEQLHIKREFARHYAGLGDMPVPISERDFTVYGVSTTPTLVLIGRDGLVAFYHPGKAIYRDLATHVREALKR